MKKVGEKLLQFIINIILSIVLLIAVGFIFGIFVTKEQIVQNACQWGASISNGSEIHIVDSRDYDSYYFILGTYNDHGAYLSSYKKLYGILPLYERHIIAANQDDDLTGIGVPLHGRYIDLLIAPPYTDILIRSENGVLCPAPETMY